MADQAWLQQARKFGGVMFLFGTFVALWILWTALLGFLAILASIWFCYAELHDYICEHSTSLRDKWLIQHFGHEGKARWLVNEALVKQLFSCDQARMALLSAQHVQAHPRVIASAQGAYKHALRVMEHSRAIYGADCFDAPSRGADGMRRGLVVDISKGGVQRDYPPWGNAYGNYPWAHALKPWTHRCTVESGSDGYRSRHGEPWGSDWLAAGYWDPIRRVDDGLVIDPISLLYEDTVRFWVHTGAPFSILPNSEDMIQRAKAEAKRRVGGHLPCELVCA
jgi:hypothetical protein